MRILWYNSDIEIANGREVQTTPAPVLARSLDWSERVMSDHTVTANELGKLYLINRGVLRPRAAKWRRIRQYSYTAQCWARHEIKERNKAISGLWRNLAIVVQAACREIVYNTFPLRTRTHVEKILNSPQPLSYLDTITLRDFYEAWNMAASKCE